MTESEEDQLLSGMTTEFQNATQNSIVDRNSGKVTQLLYALKQFFITYAQIVGIAKLNSLSTISELSSFSRGGVNSVLVSDPMRGGTFYYYPSGYVADGGTVIAATGGGFWVRQYSGPVNAGWFDTTGDVSVLSTLVGLFGDIILPAITYTGTLTISRSGLNIAGATPVWNGTSLSGGTILTGNIVVTGNYNTIKSIGITNTTGNGVVIRDNASGNKVESCTFNILNHGVLIEQFGGTAKDNSVSKCDSYGGIHGFVSKSTNAVFASCRSYSASSEGFALVSDNITGVAFPSICTNNQIINCEVYNSSFGIKVYSRDYSSTNNANNILLRNVSIVGGVIDGISSYGISIGDDVTTPPGGQTYNEAKNISVEGVSVSNITGPWAVKFGRCDGVAIGNNNIVGAMDRSLLLAKNVVLAPNTVAGGSLGNVVYNYIFPVNTDGPSVAFGDGYFETANTANTTLTNLSGGKIGKVVTIVLGDDFTTIAKSGQFLLSNYVRGKGSVVVLKYKNDGSAWQEIYSRSTANVQFYNYIADYSIDPANGRLSTTYITGNVNSIAFVTPQKNSDFRVVLGASGTFSLTGWDSRIVWLTGGAPTKVTSSSRIVLDFYYDGTNIHNIGKSGTDFQSSKSYTPGTISTATEITTTVTVPGASLGKMAIASFSNDLLGCKIISSVSATDTVTVTIRNDTGTSQVLATGTLFARVIN